MLRNALSKNETELVAMNRPEEVPGRLDFLWELHEAVLGIDAPVDGPGDGLPSAAGVGPPPSRCTSPSSFSAVTRLSQCNVHLPLLIV